MPDDFNIREPGTWNARDRAVYEVGYAEGAHNELASMWAILDDHGVNALVAYVSAGWTV